MHPSHRKGGKDWAGKALSVLEAVRSLQKSCGRKQCASPALLSESLEESEKRARGRELQTTQCLQGLKQL